MKLYLDDERQPQQCIPWMKFRIGDVKAAIYNESWMVVTKYEEFIGAVEKHYKDITHVSFDHDLAEIKYDPMTQRESFAFYEKTGLDCAEYFKSFYEAKGIELPIIFVHSMNGDGGKEKIINLFK